MNDYSDLRALYINTTLKPSGRAPSHTERLMTNSMEIMREQGVTVDYIRAADHTIAFGVQPDMREAGAERDDWPEHIWPKVEAADILVIGSPIWLGEESSLCRVIIERLYGHSGQQNDKGQYIFYGKTGGTIITGNEDGVKHVAMSVLYAMQHVGYMIPPQADAGWIGEVGPGPSYGDEGGVGLDNNFTKRNTTFMTWNLLHTARLLKDAGGLPAHGNQVDEWNEGRRFDHPEVTVDS